MNMLEGDPSTQTINDNGDDAATGQDHPTDMPQRSASSMDASELLEPFCQNRAVGKNPPKSSANEDGTAALWRSLPRMTWTSTTRLTSDGAKSPGPTNSDGNSVRSSTTPPLHNRRGNSVLSTVTTTAATATATTTQSESIWNAFPMLWAGTTTEKREKTQKEKDQEKLIATIQDEEGFRELQEELRKTRMLTGTELAVEAYMAKRRSIVVNDVQPGRQIRRSSSFSHPLRSKHTEDIGETNLSAFREMLDD